MEVRDPPDPPTTPSAQRHIYNPGNGALSTMDAETSVYYFPNGRITATLE